MPNSATPLHADLAWQSLARHEQRLLHVPARPIAPMLWISADPSWSELQRNEPLLTRLHPVDDRLEGDLLCRSDALPIERDSVQTIVVQHAADVLDDIRPLLRELCRILEPGGQLFWFGLNPISGWAAWSYWRSRGSQTMRARDLGQIDRLLAAEGVDATDSRYLGGLWPKATPINEARRITLIDGFRGAWLLSARKRRAVLTPLRAAAKPQRLRRPTLSALPSSRNQP